MMARISRQELKQDEFIDTVDATLDYFERHARTLIALGVIIVLGGGSAGGYLWYKKTQTEEASATLGLALMTYQAPVQAGLPPLPGEAPQQAYASEEEKYQAALEAFTAVREEFPDTRQAQLARHYEALCHWQLGEQQQAVALLEALGEAADPEVAAVSRFHLAGFYESVGRTGEARKLYRALVENPTSTLPRAAAQLALADLLADEDPAAARRLLEEVRDAFPDTRIASEARRRLDLLPPVPVSRTTPAEPAAERP